MLLRTTHIRYLIVTMLFVASCFSYGDRVALSLRYCDAEGACARSGEAWVSALGLQFGLMCLASCPLRIAGSFRIQARLGISIVCLDVCALLKLDLPDISLRHGSSVRFLFSPSIWLAQSPVFPGNGRIVCCVVSTEERGGASAIFNASQYFALVAFAPLFGWLTHAMAG